MAGVLAGANLRKAGVERIRIIDQAGGIGGTWYWNRYPGVMCDVESYVYLPMLEELDYVPTERYASGEEIRLHLQALAERFDLMSEALFHTGLTSAEWDEGAGRWRIHTDRGDVVSCRYYVLATGILNLLKLPAIPGMHEFAGQRVPHRALGLRVHRWWPGSAPHAARRQGRRDDRHRCERHPGAPAAGGRGEARLRLPAHAVGQSGVRGNRATDPAFAEALEPGWQQARMDNLQTIMMGKPVEADLTDDGWTHPLRGGAPPAAVEGHERRGVHPQR